MRKINVLCVDDDPVSLNKMVAIMEEIGDCRQAETGKEAVTVFFKNLEAGNTFDLITLDISLPDMEGTEVLRILRQIEADKGIAGQKRAKIIMVTSHADKGRVVASLKAGCNDYIVKPFDINTLISKVEQFGF